MFRLGNLTRRSRRGTFSTGGIRGAALAGLGVLAWRWWRGRQGSESNRLSDRDRSFSEKTPHPGAQI
jgi:hypothetical protein